MRTLFKNAKVLNLDHSNGYYNGYVVVNNNIIEYAGESLPDGDFDEQIDVSGNVLMPGFINAHAHTPMAILRGVKDDVNLNEWLFDGVVPIEQQMTKQDIYWAEMLGIAECVKNGITTLEEGYFHFDAMADAIAKSGIRARIGIGPRIQGSNSTNYYENLKQTFSMLKQKDKNGLITCACFAHAIYTISDEIFEQMLKFANDYNLSLSIHLSETLKEVGDCTAKNGGLTPPALLEKMGYLDRKCLAYHCVHMDKDDLQILADYDVDVATCPSSNIKLASGIAPVYAMQNKGLNIAIGTDGAASNNCLDMFKEMFLVATLSKVSLYDASVVSARDVLKMATINGAKALQINSGEIKAGKNADIILVNIKDPHMQPEKNIVSNLVYSARGSDVYFTMVNGKVLYKNGEFNIGENIQTIIKKANEIRNKLEK